MSSSRSSQFHPQIWGIVLVGVFGLFILYVILSLFHCPQNVNLLIIINLGLVGLFFLLLPLGYKSSLDSARRQEGSKWILQREVNKGTSKELPKYFRQNFRLTDNDLEQIFRILVTKMKAVNTTQSDTFDTIIYIRYDLEESLNDLEGSPKPIQIQGKNVDETFIKQIFREENTAIQPIMSLKIVMYNTNRPSSADISQITFEISKKEHTSIRYYVTGNNDAEVEYTIKLLSRILYEIKFNGGIPGYLIGWSILGVLLWMIMVVCLFYEFLSLSLNIALGGIILIGLCLLLSIGGAVTYLIYSPSYNFCWGEYTKFFDGQISKGKWFRNNALGFAFGIIAAILATYFTTTINIRPPGP